MDRKSIIIVIICIGLLFGWHQLINRMYPPQPVPPADTNVVATAQGPAIQTTNGAAPAPVITSAPTTEPQFVVNTNTAEELIVVANENAKYTFTSWGGGIKLVELVGYPETVTRRGKRAALQEQRWTTLNTYTPAPTLAVLNGDTVQGDGIFTLTRTGNGVRAEKVLPNGLAIVKEFQLSTNFLVTASVRLENRSDQPLSLPQQSWVVGTATPTGLDDSGAGTVGVTWYDGGDDHSVDVGHFASTRLGCLPRTPPAEYRAGEGNVFWAAVRNQFFALAVMPKDPAAQVVVRKVNLPLPTAEEILEHPRAVRAPEGTEAAMVYPAVTLGPNQILERQFFLFTGPKEYRTLASIAAGFNNNLDLIMGFGGFFGFFSKALLLGMNWLNDALKLSYGWAIIAITIIIKILFWPLTAASTRSMKRMAALQPQMKALQEKHKDDPMKAQRKMMEFMKENKVNPLGGCLPMLLQMPVFIGFFYMIRSAIELRGASFLWVADLSKPDTIFTIPGIDFPFNPLPLIMGGTMLWQAHLTPPSPGMDAMQQKLMRYMPLIFIIFLYNYSSGLALYWTVNNLLTIVQTKLTKTRIEPAPVAKPALTPPPKKKK